VRDPNYAIDFFLAAYVSTARFSSSVRFAIFCSILLAKDIAIVHPELSGNRLSLTAVAVKDSASATYGLIHTRLRPERFALPIFR